MNSPGKQTSREYVHPPRRLTALDSTAPEAHLDSTVSTASKRNEEMAGLSRALAVRC